MDPSKVTTVQVHPGIYNAYLILYIECCTLVERMDAVLDDGEHCLLVEEATQSGFKMPDIEFMRDRTNELRDALMVFNPYNVRIFRDGMVLLPIESARGFYNVAASGQKIVSGVFDAIEKTNYLSWFTVLKNMGAPYSGPTSLQEVINVWAGIDRGAHSERTYAHPKALPRSWFDPRLG